MSQQNRPGRRAWSLTARLTTLSLLAFAASLLSGGYAAWTIAELNRAQRGEQQLNELCETALQLDELHESLRADLYAAYAGLGDVTAETQDDVKRLQSLALDFADGQHGDALRRIGSQEFAFSLEITSLLDDATHDSMSPTQLQSLRTASAVLGEQLHTERERLEAEQTAASKTKDDTTREALIRLAAVSTGLGLLLLMIGWTIRRWLLRSLGHLATAAAAIADGDLSARTGIRRNDEIGQLARVLDESAASLQAAWAERDATAHRQEFRAALDRALNQAGDDASLADVVRRALVAVNPERAAELLVADSSEAHLEPLAVTPGVEPPGCAVASPWACPAVRGGRASVFPSSEAIDGCLRLRGRPGGALSAVCVPISFMGRVTGVLHATGEVGTPPGPEELFRLEALAEQAGTRLGALRAMEQVQRQASVDGLTGLMNRRTFEDAVRRLTSRGDRYAVLLADLDRFKQINDTFGHAAGDLALRRFAEVLRGCLREDDLACRFGGEEFAVVLPGMDAAEGVEAADRIRDALRTAPAHGPVVTVSIGVTDSTAGVALADQLARADDALLIAKRTGRDRSVVAGAARPAQDEISELPAVAGR